MLDPDSLHTLKQLANERGIDAAGLLAVCEVESGGKLFARIEGRDEPLIRFEGHYFYRLLGAAKRNLAVTRGLAHHRAGRVRNPISQKGRWRLLHRASAIDRHAALQSCSWGIGQVMGAHWRWLSYASVDAMIAEARSGLRGQAELMLRFIEKTGLDEALAEGDWRAFARGYNGPAYASNRYDTRLAKAHARYREHLGLGQSIGLPNRHEPLLLRYGDRGDAVAMLQRQLRRAGFWLKADGDFGPATKAAVTAFQAANGLTVDGIVGPGTFLALEHAGHSLMPV